MHGILLEPAFSQIIPKLHGTMLAMLLCKGIVLEAWVLLQQDPCLLHV